MYSIAFRYLLNIEVDKKLETRLMNVYGKLNIDMYMKAPVWLVEFQHSQRQHQHFRLEKAMYGLKHVSMEWYKRLRDFWIDQGFKVDEVCPCIVIKRTHPWLVIVAICVDDLNLIGTADVISHILS